MERKNETSQGFLRNWKGGLTIIVVGLLAVVFVWFQLRDKSTGSERTDSIASAPTPSSIQGGVVLPTGTIEPGESDALGGTSSVTEPTVEVPVPTATLTKAEIVAHDIAQSGGQFTASFSNCLEILENEPSCVVIRTGIQVSRPEWEALFPQAEFYLVKYDLDRGETVERKQGNLLVVEQDGQRLSLFPDRMFEQLLETNRIVITSQNQEQVARALVLMRLPDYLENDIVFSNWREGEWAGYHFNYALNVWTEINGLEFEWGFWFDNEQLLRAQGFLVRNSVGDYINVSVMSPSPDTLIYSWSQP